MNQNTKIQTPPPLRNKRRKNNNGKVIGICSLIAVSGVLLSVGGGYFGARVAIEGEGITSSGSGSSQTYNSSSILTSGNDQTYAIEVTDVSDIVAQIKPTVVEITTEIVSSGNSIFGQYIASGAGSGVILSSDGYIVTNNHVIEDASSIQVKTTDGSTYDATLVGTDPQTDIAVLKIDTEGLSAAVIGSSDDIQVGEAAIAIGNPLGSLGGTVTTGIISAVGREITINNETMTLLQTDAAINQGNSGGGLFDINGQLIGIVNAKQAATGIEGLGFAIPISDVTSVIDDLVANGTVTFRPMLNVSLQDVSMGSMYSSQEPGVYIVQVVEGGTADNAGLQTGDQILSFDGTDVSTAAEVKSILKKHAIGDEVLMTINREGEIMEVVLTLQGSSS